MSVELKYNYETTTAAMKEFNQKHINSLREWTQSLDKSKLVPKDLSDQQLVLFYNACTGDMELTRRCVEKYYACRKTAPEFFSDRRVDAEDVKESVEALEFAVLPQQSLEGYDVVYHRLHHTDPSKYHLVPGIKLLLMTVDACLYARGPQPGIIFLFDMRGVKLTHLTRLSVGALRKFFTYIQEAMPVRMKAIHIMNAVPFFDKVLAVLRPFMDKNVINMIKLHTSSEDLSEFYASVLPRSALPPDYGGELPDTRCLHEGNTRQLRAMEPYFRCEEEQRAGAAPAGSENGVAQSFTRLEID